MTSTGSWVSDEVWAQLDPAVGRLSRRDRRWVAFAVLALLLATAAFVVGRVSGELHPKISIDQINWTEHPSSHKLVVRYSFRNDDWFDETVTGIDETSQYVDLTKASATRFVIPAGRTHAVVLTFHVRDCSNVDTDQPRMILKLHRFWGTTKATIPALFFDPGNPIAEVCGSH